MYKFKLFLIFFGFPIFFVCLLFWGDTFVTLATVHNIFYSGEIFFDFMRDGAIRFVVVQGNLYRLAKLVLDSVWVFPELVKIVHLDVTIKTIFLLLFLRSLGLSDCIKDTLTT